MSGEGGSASGAESETEGPFLLDVMLGTLASYLRMCGYDAAYALDRDVEADGDVQALARAEGRTLLTRDVRLAERAERSLLLTAREPTDQLRELADAGVPLDLDERPSRCGRCNGSIEPVPVDAETPDYAPEPSATPQWRCTECGQVFWKGSHWNRVRETLAGLDAEE
ncbi:MAG: Mut7-C RNAse domain-containing protein [Haloarculaceae archaeon]